MRVPATVLLGILLATPAAGQLGGEPTGYSALAAGRAGAGAAAADSLLESARNPAILGFLLGDGGPGQAVEADLRAFWAPASGRNTISGERFRADASLAGAAWLGWGMDLGGGHAVALTLLPTFAGDIEVRRQTLLELGVPRRSREIPVDNRLIQVGLQPSWAWRVSDQLAIGAGASIRHTRIGLQSATEFGLLDTLQGEILPGTTWGEFLQGLWGVNSFQAEYDGDVEADLMAGLMAGLVWAPREETRVAVWYRSATLPADLTGNVVVDLNPELGPIINGEPFNLDGRTRYDLRFEDIRFPQQLGIGVSHAAGPADRVHLDFSWTDWSATFNGFTALLTNPSNPDFTNLIGGDGSTSFDMDLRWRDVWTAALAVEHDFSPAWTVRAGVGWMTSPTAGAVSPGSHVFNTWHVAMGASWRSGASSAWHVALVGALPEVYRAGPNSVLSDFSYDRYRVAIWSLAVGWSVRW